MTARLAAIVCAVLCCLSLGWAMVQQRHMEWQTYQRQYIDALPSGSSQTKRLPGVLEIRVDSFGERRVDRCTTCHLAVSNPDFVGRPPPLSFHPRIDRHDFGTFGCTLCHQGEGRLLTKQGAHGFEPACRQPLLDLRYVEASCTRCHVGDEADRVAPKVASGRALFMMGDCFGCHQIAGLADGAVGPDLTAVGARRSAEALRVALTDPTSDAVHSPMPPWDPARSDELDALVTFLKSLRGARETYVYQR